MFEKNTRVIANCCDTLGGWTSQLFACHLRRMEKPDQPPEGRLIQEALKKTGMSARKAADAAGISDSRWRHIVNGYQPAGRGEFVRVVGPADTVARMARVVGVMPIDMRMRGKRPDVSELLAQEMQVAQPVGHGLDDEAEGLTPEEIQPVLDQIRLMKKLKGLQ